MCTSADHGGQSSLFWVEGTFTLNDFRDHHKPPKLHSPLYNALMERQSFPFSRSKRLRVKDPRLFSRSHSPTETFFSVLSARESA